jgi:uncharacterized protein (DUF1501 family)
MTKRIAYIHLAGGAHAPTLFTGPNITDLHPAAINLKQLAERGMVHAVLCTGPENPNSSHEDMTRIQQDRGNFLTGELGEGWGDYSLAATFPPTPLMAVTVQDTVVMPVLKGGRASTMALATNLTVSDGFGIEGMIAAANMSVDLPIYWKTVYQSNLSVMAAASGINLSYGSLGQTMGEVLVENPDIKMVTGISGGFDTHTDHEARFASSFTRFDAALGEFARICGWLEMPDGEANRLPYPIIDEVDNLADDVLMIVTTEFSRDNIRTSAGGYSHGRGGFTLVIGRSVKGGFTNTLPSLEFEPHRLDAGRNLPVEIPTERVILSLLQDAGWKSEGVFTKAYEPLPGIFLPRAEPDPLPEAGYQHPQEQEPEPKPENDPQQFTEVSLLMEINTKLEAIHALMLR